VIQIVRVSDAAPNACWMSQLAAANRTRIATIQRAGCLIVMLCRSAVAGPQT